MKYKDQMKLQNYSGSYKKIKVGDIISLNEQCFLLLDILDESFLCIPLDNKIDNLSNLNYSRVVSIKNTEKVKHVNNISNNCLKFILKKYKEYITKCTNEISVQRGNVILKDNKYYYVYGEEGQNWLVFEIRKVSSYNLEPLKIGYNTYYTDYSDFVISKKDNYTIIWNSDNYEKNRIKSSRKYYKEKQKINNYPVNLASGDIVEQLNCKNQRYIIVKVHKKTYECLGIEDLKKAVYNTILVDKTDVKLSDDTSINGIKWLEEHQDFSLQDAVTTNIINDILNVQKEYIQNNNIISNDDKIIQIGDKVCKNNFIQQTFVVIDIIGNMVVCVGASETHIKNPSKYYFNKNELSIVPYKQKRK